MTVHEKGKPSFLRTPKGLHLLAQGCRAAATLGRKDDHWPTPKGLHRPDGKRGFNPFGVGRRFATFSQGSRFAATLGFEMRPLRGKCDRICLPCKLTCEPWY